VFAGGRWEGESNPHWLSATPRRTGGVPGPRHTMGKSKARDRFGHPAAPPAPGAAATSSSSAPSTRAPSPSPPSSNAFGLGPSNASNAPRAAGASGIPPPPPPAPSYQDLTRRVRLSETVGTRQYSPSIGMIIGDKFVTSTSWSSGHPGTWRAIALQILPDPTRRWWRSWRRRW